MSQAKADTTKPTGSERLSQRITDDVRFMIQNRALTEGDKLPTERELAESYEVSRLAVREAMRNLEESGLISIRKGRYGGAFVTPSVSPVFSRTLKDMVSMGAASIENMIEARGMIMGQVVQMACASRTESDLADLQEQLALVRRRPTSSDNMDERTSQALNFNVYIARAAGNPVLVTLVEALTSSMEDLVRPIRPSSFAPLVTYYTQMVDAIEARNPDAAASAMSNYLESIKGELLGRIR